MKLILGSRISNWSAVLAPPSLFFVAYVASLFFLGFNIEILSVSLIFLVVIVFWGLSDCHRTGLVIPSTGLVIYVLLYWGWQAVALLWSPVPFVSTTMFWWMSSLPLAFWLYLLLPSNRRWSWFAIPILLSGLGLVFTGAYQLLVAGKTPDSLFLDVNIHAALLNLIALPTCGYFLVLLSNPQADNRFKMLMGLSFFILTYGILLTRSRGGILSFLICAGVLLVMALRRVSWKIAVVPASLIVISYLFADLSWAGALTERAKTLSDIHAAGAGRFSIWRQSWLLLQQSPFWGAGLGIYSLLWPPYREPQDGSAGYFVHNDYLQVWIEAGLPGLFLFLALLGSALWAGIRALGNSRLPRATHLEIIGLGMGLTAIALHSLVQYNFYVVPILLLYGLGLARLQELWMAHAIGKPKVWQIQPARYFSADGYRLIIFFLALLPLGYLASIGISAHQSARGVMLAEAGRTDEAEQALIIAHRFWPDADTPLFTRADLYRFMLMQSTNEGMTPRRKILFDTADELLAEAERLNPLRPHTFTLRAELYRIISTFAGSLWREKIEQAYQHAIYIDPRFYEARYGYASYLLIQGDTQKAREILEAGMRYTYRDNDQIMLYFSLTADVLERAGASSSAEELWRRVESYKKLRAHPSDG